MPALRSAAAASSGDLGVDPANRVGVVAVDQRCDHDRIGVCGVGPGGEALDAVRFEQSREVADVARDAAAEAVGDVQNAGGKRQGRAFRRASLRLRK